jgi:hypothetical protein
MSVDMDSGPWERSTSIMSKKPKSFAKSILVVIQNAIIEQIMRKYLDNIQ